MIVRILIPVYICLFSCLQGKAQHNMTLLSNIPYQESLSDIWGYHSNGKEYALVGTRAGVSIVDVTDPDKASEVALVTGPRSGYRDIKTWKNYGYVVTEVGGGIQIFDLSGLPNPPPSIYFQPDQPWGDSLKTCHNLFIDENGFCYLTGCNVNNGGTIIFDLNKNPLSPKFVGSTDPNYVHDAFVRNDTLINSEIYEGVVTIWDVRNKSQPQKLASRETPSAFPHNSGLSSDGKTLFSADERLEAPVTSLNISDLDDIEILDIYKPFGTEGFGILPHNVMVMDDYVFIAYYSEGCIVLDGSEPDNLIEVAAYDTYLPFRGGFVGAWGVYPFLPSGNILVSDIQHGLFVLKPELKRACRLEGVVKDASTGQALRNVEIVINGGILNKSYTDFQGIYKTGIAKEGVFEVLFQLAGYQPQALEVIFTNGEILYLDVELVPLPKHSLTIKLELEKKMTRIPGAKILLQNDQISYGGITDENGEVFFPSIFEGEYKVYAGKWGFIPVYYDLNLKAGQEISLSLSLGYYDDFNLDLGWQVKGTAYDGHWERGTPSATYSEDFLLINPPHDANSDEGNSCYVTGLPGGSNSAHDLDDGVTILESPVADLSNMIQPEIFFTYWFVNFPAFGPPDDTLKVKVVTPSEIFEIARFSQTEFHWRQQSLLLPLEVAERKNLKFVFEISDRGNENTLEAGVDEFYIAEGYPVEKFEKTDSEFGLMVFPSPFPHNTRAAFKLPSGETSGRLIATNILGQKIMVLDLYSKKGLVEFGTSWAKGIYFVYLEASGTRSDIITVIKN